MYNHQSFLSFSSVLRVTFSVIGIMYDFILWLFGKLEGLTLLYLMFSQLPIKSLNALIVVMIYLHPRSKLQDSISL